MKRDIKLFIKDIIDHIDLIESSLDSKSKDYLRNDINLSDATIRRLEVIGEAIKNIPANIRDKYPSVDWKGFTGLRDIIIHSYFRINLDLSWDIIKNDLPILKKQMFEILNDLEKDENIRKWNAN